MDDWGSLLTKVWNILSGLAIVGTIIGWFPYVAAFAAFLFYIIQIKDSRTVREIFTNRRRRKIAKLKVLMAQLEAADLIERQSK